MGRHERHGQQVRNVQNLLKKTHFCPIRRSVVLRDIVAVRSELGVETIY